MMITDKGEAVLTQMPVHQPCNLCIDKVKKPLFHPLPLCIYRKAVAPFVNQKILKWNLKE
jgi:hypothetical protein